MENLFPNTANCPVNDLLHIVHQHDVEQLRNALLDVIDNFQPGGEIYLYEQGYSVFDTQNKDFSPILLGVRGDSEACESRVKEMLISVGSAAIQFDGFQYLPTDDYVQVFTVESERTSRGLLITVNSEIIDETYIEILLSAYNHQIYLLRNKDTDSLTGLYNRQLFDSRMNKIHQTLGMVNRSGDQSHNHCLAIFDIDLFKLVNDEYGHIYGDEVLLLFANIMKSTFRDIDLLFRYGGEEFAILLNDVDLEQAGKILHRFRENIQKYSFPMGNLVTTSIGYSAFDRDVPLANIIERADKALYYAKENGRNNACCYEELVESGKLSESGVNDSEN